MSLVASVSSSTADLSDDDDASDAAIEYDGWFVGVIRVDVGKNASVRDTPSVKQMTIRDIKKFCTILSSANLIVDNTKKIVLCCLLLLGAK